MDGDLLAWLDCGKLIARCQTVIEQVERRSRPARAPSFRGGGFVENVTAFFVFGRAKQLAQIDGKTQSSPVMFHAPKTFHDALATLLDRHPKGRSQIISIDIPQRHDYSAHVF